MAIHAGLLGWSIKPLQTTRDLLRRARELRTADAQEVNHAVDLLREAMRDPNRVPLVKPGAKIKVGGERRVIGVRLGRDRVGLRKDGVASVVGSAMVDPVMKRMREAGAIETGHGGKSAQQLPVLWEEGGEIHRKPRFVVVNPEKLSAIRKSAA
jgi:hypothetical protein